MLPLGVSACADEVFNEMTNVRFWYKADIAIMPTDVRFWG